MVDDIRDFLVTELVIKYAKKENEWVEVYITPLNRIDLTIVSEDSESYDAAQITEYVKQLLNAKFPKEANEFSIGFLDIYNIEESMELALHKPVEEKTPITWSDVVAMGEQMKSRGLNRDYTVNCFYSYKGGVGRTTSLIQIAYSMARQGKNIVLLDFDIEAPSFHLLFKKWIDDPLNGIKYGLVEYLYERMVNVDPKDFKIKITDIFVPIKLDEAIEGNIYVVPATTKLTSKYIFELAQLQSGIIFENDYMEELLESLTNCLSFDTVFIDTRTGINQWGAFSLLGFADQTILMASPNDENIEGISNIIDLMKKAGLDNYVVAMSKFDTNNQGIKLAKEYFEKLGDIGQEFIGIEYLPSFLMMDKFPFTDILAPYEVLTDYILESQIVKFNESLLGNIDRFAVMDKVAERLRVKKEEVKNFSNIDIKEFWMRPESIDSGNIMNLERKILTDENINLVVNGGEDEIKRLMVLFKLFSDKERRRDIYREESGKLLFSYKKVLPLFDRELKENVLDSILKEGSVKNWMTYFAHIINSYTAAGIKGIKDFSGKSINELCDYFSRMDLKEIIDVLKKSVIGNLELYDSLTGITKNTETMNDVVLCLFDVQKLDFNRDVEALRSLVESMSIIKKEIPEIRMLLFVNRDFYNLYQNELTDLKGYMLELEWKEDDVKRLMVQCLNPSDFVFYADSILKDEKIAFKIKRKSCILEKYNLSKTEDFYKLDIDSITSDEAFLDHILNFFWGIRINPKRYSQKMGSWFYDKLENTLGINCKTIITLILNAIEIEKEVSKNGDVTDRLISRSSFEESIKRLLL